jgi:tetratricopeptide (TPR) repeat protein
VDTGAIDSLEALAGICRRERLWFHVDGACGALAVLAPDLAPRLKGIECADSLAFDFHKWGQVPYDAGFILVRDGVQHRNTFAVSPPYLRKALRGLAAGSPWFCDYGPDLSRGFRALKTWFTLKVYGTEALGAVISRTCALARYLENRIAETPELELLAPVELNVVCFGYRSGDAQRINPRIVIELQESGAVAPSSTVIHGRLAIRVAIVNHRTGRREMDILVEKTVALGRAIEASAAQSRAPQQAAGADWPPQRAREAALRDLNGRIASNPGAVSLRFELACLLTEMGRTLEARNAYLDVLAREPSHLLALNNLGTLLHATGYRTAARTAYAEAVARHPEDAMSRVNLGNVLYESGEFRAAREHYETAIHFEPGHTEAHQGLAYVLAELGDERARSGTGAEALRTGLFLRFRTAETGPRYPCFCWFRQWVATYRPAICWTTASSRRSWWCPSFTIATCRCRRIKWYSTPSATPTWPLLRWLPRSLLWRSRTRP